MDDVAPNLAGGCPDFRAGQRLRRREVVRAGSLALFGMGAPELFRAQAAAARWKFLRQASEFIVTAVLIGGACAWLYKWWLTRQ